MTAKYEQAQKNFLGEFKEVYGNEKDAMLRLNKADFGVRMNQFVTNHPDVEKQFEKIKDDRWWKILGKGFAEKGVLWRSGLSFKKCHCGGIGLYWGADCGCWNGRMVVI